MATFAQILPLLQNHVPVFRLSDPKDSFTFRQIPATIPNHIIPNITSAPDSVKELLAARGCPLESRDQIVMVDAMGLTTYRAFTGEDLFADDWYRADNVPWPQPGEETNY